MQDLREELVKIKVISAKTGKLNPRYKYILYNRPEYLQFIVEKTCFLKYDAPIKTRLQCILQNITEQPICLRCKDPCKMTLNGSKYNNKFSKHCSRRCAGLESGNINRRKDPLV